MARAFVSMGSNIDPEENIAKALRALSRAIHITKLSTIYLTEPENRPEQPLYYNCVVEIETTIPPIELKRQILRRIEDALGRKRNDDKYAARTIDLDLILYDKLMMMTADLMIPDPDIVRRPFLAIPLFELAPSLVLPGSGERIDTVATALMHSPMKPLQDYTERLRKELLHGRKQ
jgi:2-amino-4-hydroxy-6-hydroxymethyldihydropteridine diphosphokinase